MCRRGEAIEPFPSAFKASAEQVIAQQLMQGRRAVHALLGVNGFVPMPVPQEWADSVWSNLNTPEDLENI
jgi:molybdopterin-guanine dinucleotide biosynthesis protein A